jgi:hypothetical protein
MTSEPSKSFLSSSRFNKKTRIEFSTRVFKLLPRRCRSGDSPVPFRKGWMTVAAEFGFQSRPVILRTNQASMFHQLSVRGRHLNREHRRVNVYIPNAFGIQKPLVES